MKNVLPDSNWHLTVSKTAALSIKLKTHSTQGRTRTFKIRFLRPLCLPIPPLGHLGWMTGIEPAQELLLPDSQSGSANQHPIQTPYSFPPWTRTTIEAFKGLCPAIRRAENGRVFPRLSRFLFGAHFGKNTFKTVSSELVESNHLRPPSKGAPVPYS